MKTFRRSRLSPWAGVFLLVLAAGACRSDPKGTKPEDQQLPTITLNEKAPNLLLTWLDSKGDFHTETSIASIPGEGREAVRVVLTDKTAGARGNLIYVADLRKKRPDGSYPVKTMTRDGWEALAKARREKRLAPFRPPAPSARPSPNPTATKPNAHPAPDGALSATVYGAAWCGPCKAAKRYLHQRGLHVTYKDIEQDRAANAEMHRLLAASGQRGGSIPVINIGGIILKGYSRGAIDAAIAKAKRKKGSTTL